MHQHSQFQDVNKKQTLQQKHQNYLSSLQKGRPSLLCWTAGGLWIKKVKKKNAACIQTHALDLKVVEKNDCLYNVYSIADKGQSHWWI